MCDKLSLGANLIGKKGDNNMADIIDAVILWVDDQDEVWRNDKQKYEIDNKRIGDNGDNRYRDWDTLKYWFRGIEMNAPWLNKIYFVTYGHLPKWLDVSHPKLVIVRHDEFIPHEYLPTFSSNPIELNLHRINGLSEKFIYFNDDMFVMNSVTEQDFFIKGLPCLVATFNAIVPEVGSSCMDYIKLNNLNIINKHIDKNQMLKKDLNKWFNFKYGKMLLKTILLLPWDYILGLYEDHSPTPFLKSTYHEMWGLEQGILEETCKHRFRHKTDVNQWLLKNWQIVNGKFIPYGIKNSRYYEIKIDNTELERTINKVKLICINDSDTKINFESAKKSLIPILERKFPEKSAYEK